MSDENEATKKRDEIVRRMLNTPPKPFTPKQKKPKTKKPRKKATPKE